MIVEQVAQVVLLLVAHRLVQGKRLPAHLQGPLRVVDRQPAQFGHFFQGRLAAFGMHQVAIDVADLAHFFDHVDRHADRAALIGDGAADGLANPPRRVGRETEAAGVFELVHRPHQPRVAFLDQVQKAQAAVAVAFGDGNDQAKVAGDQVAAGRLVQLAQCGDSRHPPLKPARGFQRHPRKRRNSLRNSSVDAAVPRHGAAGPCMDMGQVLAEGRHLLAHLAEALVSVLQALHPQTDFLDQAGSPAAAAGQTRDGPGGGRQPAGGGPWPARKSCWFRSRSSSKVRRLASIRRNRPPAMLGSLSEISTACSIRMLPVSTSSKMHRAILQDVVAFQNRKPQIPPRPFDAPRRGQFLAAGEQRNVPHLHQVRADRPRLIFLHCCLLEKKDRPWRVFLES